MSHQSLLAYTAYMAKNYLASPGLKWLNLLLQFSRLTIEKLREVWTPKAQDH